MTPSIGSSASSSSLSSLAKINSANPAKPTTKPTISSFSSPGTQNPRLRTLHLCCGLTMRNTMRGSIGNGSMLTQNNMIRARKSAPAPVHRGDSSRIETWRDEVNVSCPAGGGGPEEETGHSGGGALRKLTKHLRRKSGGSGANTSVGSGGKEVRRTEMYDGCKAGERHQEDWEEGAGESMYFGSEIGAGEGDGRLERAEQLLAREGKTMAEQKGPQANA